MFIHKRGDTFDLVGPVSLTFDGNPVQDFTGWVPNAQLRNTADDLVAQFVCEWVDPIARLLRVYFPGPTNRWELGCHEFDIQFTAPNGAVVSTQTAEIEIVRDITR